MELVLIKGQGQSFNFRELMEKKKNSISLKKACAELDKLKVKYHIKNSNHIRVGNINFYLSTGTCYIDGAGGAYKGKGVEFLKELIRKEQNK